MKRTYDVAMGNSGGQISTGQTAITDNVWFNSNMVNLQREDRSSIHGIQASLSQTRILPIVGKTNKAEIALKSADVQTKCLPIFQPQVELGQTDVNLLTYEAGLQGVWSGSILKLPVDGSLMDTCNKTLYPDTTIKPFETFNNVYQDYYDATELMDSYGLKAVLSFPKGTALDTTVSNFIDYYLSLSTTRRNYETNKSQFTKTCLTPVVIPSVYQKLVGMGPFQSSVEYPRKLFVPVESTKGFHIGDRVQFFGINDFNNFDQYVPTRFGTIIDTIDYSLLQSPSIDQSPCLVVDYYASYSCTGWNVSGSDITFTLQPNSTFTSLNLYPGMRLGLSGLPSTYVAFASAVFIIDVGGIDITTALGFIKVKCGLDPNLTDPGTVTCTVTDQTIYENGYIINLAAKDGGKLQFLTDEYEFTPLQPNQGVSVRTDDATLQLRGSLTITNQQDINYMLAGSGWFRNITIGSQETSNDQNFVVQVTMTPPPGFVPTLNVPDGDYYNGIYRVSSRILNSSFNYEFHLSPLSLDVLGTHLTTQPDLTDWSCVMKLAPNFYTVNTQVENIDVTSDIKNGRLNYLKTVGFTPTSDLQLGTPTYPPTATLTDRSWLRAYYVQWQLSAYEKLIYSPQDVSAATPKEPMNQQDFGYDDAFTSTYYNVYDMASFYNLTVNPSILKLVNDPTDGSGSAPGPFVENSLNKQLELCHNAYKKLFGLLSPNIGYSPAFVYNVGTLVISQDPAHPTWTNGQYAFMAITKNIGIPLPTVPQSSDNWFYLGRCPRNQILTGVDGSGNPTAAIEDYWQLNLLYNAYPNTTNTSIKGTNIATITGLLQPLVQTFYNECSNVAMFQTYITLPLFKTIPPRFSYDAKTFLSSVTYDTYGFPLNHTLDITVLQSSNRYYKRLSFGQPADEYVEFETNTALKFLLDNFPCVCVQYNDPIPDSEVGNRNPIVSYWIWDNSSDDVLSSRFLKIEQNSESISSCMSPIQSIVIISENIPVVEELSTPQYLLQDSNSSAFISKTETTALTQKIIGEFFVPYSPALGNSRSAVKFEEQELKFYSLLDTKSFKQIDYSLYYRHRISQQLIPLILSNYGSVNIKFIFRPTSS